MFGKADIESKNKLFQTILKTTVPLDTLINPLSFEMFINPTVSSMSFLSQILGLNSDSMVSKVILGILLYLSQSASGIKFNEFLDGEINSQLEKFDLDKHFRYQVYLFSIIVSSNRQTLEVMDIEVFKCWPWFVQKFQNYTLLIDRIVLSICRLFDPKEKRISEDMKASLQQEGIGDWFMMQKYSVIRV